VLGAVVAQTDITRLQASEREFRHAFLSGPTPSARLAADTTVEQVNPALRRLLALPTGALVGRPLAELVATEDRATLDGLLRGDATGPAEIRVLRAGGSPVWCEVSATAVTASFDSTAVAMPGPRRLLVQLLDVHERRGREQRLEAAAQRDPLTGLANRTVANTRLAELSGQPAGQRTVLAYLDLDGFKAVNDTHGHDAGDAVLIATAARLRTVVRAGDEVVRLGGDEFLLICPVDLAAPGPAVDADRIADEVAARLIERVEALLVEPVDHDGARVTVGASVGTLVAHGGEDPVDVLTRADQAMYERKRARKSGASAAARTGPEAERRRLHVLHGLDVLDTAPDPVLDELVQVAAAAAGVPTALVSLVDEHRQWFKARCGLDVQETGRDVSFCAHVVDTDCELHVHDATTDPRFAENALVTGDPRIRSYAGFPLRTTDSHVLGSLCVIGYLPGTLDDAQRQVLRVLAARVAARLTPATGGGSGAAGLRADVPAPRPVADDGPARVTVAGAP
jgi:diguanylate cyclase (GGDEF)-like protein